MKTVSQITTPLFTKITACERVWFSNIDALEQLDWGQRVKAGEEGSKCCHGELIPHRTRVTGSHGSADVQSAGFSMTKFEHFHGFTSPLVSGILHCQVGVDLVSTERVEAGKIIPMIQSSIFQASTVLHGIPWPVGKHCVVMALRGPGPQHWALYSNAKTLWFIGIYIYI